MIISRYGLDIFAFVVAVFIYFDASKTNSRFLSQKIFMLIVKIALILIVVDVLADIFNKIPNRTDLMVLNTVFNLLLFILGIVPVALWLIYADFQIFRSPERTKRMSYVALSIFAVNAVLSLASIATGWYFTIDANNAYHRGSLFWVYAFISYAVFTYSAILIVLNRKMIDKKYYKSLLLFPIPQLLGTILQLANYGVLLVCPTMMLSVLFIYFNIQEVGLNTDYLTGVYNRRLLDSYLGNKIRAATKGKGFSAILMDIDNFKQINDRFGHYTGDEALKDTAKMLQSCIKSEDYIARFGGDEFYILLDTDDRQALNEMVAKINEAKDEFNRKSEKPYKINFSMGYDVYDRSSKLGLEKFMQRIDSLMYEQKDHSK